MQPQPNMGGQPAGPQGAGLNSSPFFSNQMNPALATMSKPQINTIQASNPQVQQPAPVQAVVQHPPRPIVQKRALPKSEIPAVPSVFTVLDTYNTAELEELLFNPHCSRTSWTQQLVLSN